MCVSEFITGLTSIQNVLVCCVQKGKKLSGTESAMWAHQKDLLLQKLETFEATNHTLRQLLLDQHCSQVGSLLSTSCPVSTSFHGALLCTNCGLHFQLLRD